MQAKSGITPNQVAKIDALLSGVPEDVYSNPWVKDAIAILNEIQTSANSVNSAGQDFEDRWLISAVYCDNDQRFSSEYPGVSALDAQINAQVERLATAGVFAEINIASVVDQQTGAIADIDSFSSEVNLEPVSLVFKRVLELAQQNVPNLPDAVARLTAEESLKFWENALATMAVEDVDSVLQMDSSDLFDWGELFSEIEAGRSSNPVVLERLEQTIQMLDTLIDVASINLDMQVLTQTKNTGLFHILEMKAIRRYAVNTLVLFVWAKIGP